MSKHESQRGFDTAVDPDLLRRTREAIMALLAENDGKMPTLHTINSRVKTSFTRLGPAVREVKRELSTTETKLANMQAPPDALRAAFDRLALDTWGLARDLQNSELVELRQIQAAKEECHRAELAELQDIVALLEQERDRETERADLAEAACLEVQSKLEASATELAAAQARLAERQQILDLLTASQSKKAGDAGVSVDTSNKSPSRQSQKRNVPETGDLLSSTPQNPEAD